MLPGRPLRTERIAHLGTADCCIHPPGRNEMIAITPPIISSKEVAQKQATPLTAPATSLTTKNRFTPNFRGWRLDENLKPKSPPYRGDSNIARISLRAANGLAARGLVTKRFSDQHKMTLPSTNILCDALHRASPDPEQP